jgi:hypothetical protein
METKQIKPRLNPEEIAELAHIAEECETTPPMLAASILRGALRAAKRYGRRIKLPVDFEILEQAPEVCRSAEKPAVKARR